MEWIQNAFDDDIAELVRKWMDSCEDSRCFDGSFRLQAVRLCTCKWVLTFKPVRWLTRMLIVRPPFIPPQAVSLRSKQPASEHSEDSISQQESFFGTNALSKRSVCIACFYRPLRVLSDPGGGCLRYYCRACGYVALQALLTPIPPCPLPSSVFAGRRFSGQPFLAGAVSRDDFKAILHTRKKTKDRIRSDATVNQGLRIRSDQKVCFSSLSLI